MCLQRRCFALLVSHGIGRQFSHNCLSCPLWLILPYVLHPAVGLVVDLLCFCIVSHSYRIKYYILRNNVVEKVGGRAQGECVENCGLAAPSTCVYRGHVSQRTGYSA